MRCRVFAGSSSSYLLYRKVDGVCREQYHHRKPDDDRDRGLRLQSLSNNSVDISNGFDQTTLGFPSSYVGALQKKSFPQITNQSLATEGTLNSGPCGLLLAQLRPWSFKVARQA